MLCAATRWFGVWLLAASCWLGLCQAKAQANLPSVPQPSAGKVTGTVVDVDGALLDGARVRLVSETSKLAQETGSDENGVFHFAGVPVGDFSVTAGGDGLEDVTVHGRMTPSGVVELPAIALTQAVANLEVTAMTPHDLAEVEVRKQEQQRLIGILPNYSVTYNWKAPPLDAKQKFELATKEVISPWTFGTNAAVVGIERATGNYDEFGPGATGYWKLYGATMASIAVGNELGGAILPSIFHQDPRYFWKGTGSIPKRALYAISRTIICRGDNGKNQPSFSGVLGDMGTGALSNLWYPKVDRRGATLTIENGLLSIVGDAIGNLEQEFVFKWFTPGSRKRKPNVDPTTE